MVSLGAKPREASVCDALDDLFHMLMTNVFVGRKTLGFGSKRDIR